MTNANTKGEPPRSGKCGGSLKQWGGSEYNTRLHVPILYGLVILLSVACSVSFWACFTQLNALRREFEGEILPKGMVDFGPASLHRYYGYGESSFEDDDDEEDEENVTSLGVAPVRSPPDIEATRTASDREKRHAHDGYEILDDVRQGDGDEDLIRVKRRSHKKRSRKRNTKEKDRRPPAFFYEGGEGSRDDPNNEGSGSTTDQHVWLTSYSRIPVFALQEFCAATRDYCPPGQPGPHGIPGKIGQKGAQGEIGHPGVAGADGMPGTLGNDGDKGDKGDIGQPGLNGTDGLIGMPGEKGDRGEGGERGSKGDMGPPGLPGSDGDKGEAGEAGVPGFNGTDGAEGPPGPPGLPGPEGPQGPPGLEGPIGPQGVQGDSGFNGTDGEKGKRGRRGQDGEAGQPGEHGARGPKGDTGDPGSDVNCTCPPGPYATGPPGPTGPMGPNGQKGQKGDQGRSNMLLDTTIGTTTTTTPVPTTPPITTPEPTIDPRTASCTIRMVGKPLFQRYTGTYWGAWMKDTFRETAPDVHKFWFTRHFTGKSLYEYANQDEFRANRESHVYSLEDLYFGTGHVVYDGHFYYHKSGTRDLVKYDLAQETAVGTLHIPDAAFQGKHYVYSTEYNYFDLATDANGLWAIYNQEGEGKHLLVSKLNTDSMEIEKTWNITLNHRGYGNGFVTCGVLYMIRNTNAKTTLIDFAYDMYTKTQLRNVRLQFTNPFQMNNMISYNHLDRKIYSWDKGNQLTYPLLLRY